MPDVRAGLEEGGEAGNARRVLTCYKSHCLFLVGSVNAATLPWVAAFGWYARDFFCTGR